MDEVEIIQNYLLSQAGENTDVILGLGYDNTLGNNLGITLIATGFEHKDPFKKEIRRREAKEEKIIMTLGEENLPAGRQRKETPTVEIKAGAHVDDAAEQAKIVDLMAPKLVDTIPAAGEPVSAMMIVEDEELEKEENEDMILQATEENKTIVWDLHLTEKPLSETTNRLTGETTGEKMILTEKTEAVFSEDQSGKSSSRKDTEVSTNKDSSQGMSAASGGYLARPSNIYAESKAGVSTPKPSAEEPGIAQIEPKQINEEPPCDMQLVMRNDIPAADRPLAHHSQQPLTASNEDPPMADENEDQQRRAAERLKKLRNLSFNINAADPNNEFETVPAYIRRNMELYGSSAQVVENFYSNYEVKTDENNQTKISTINTFLDGKKPD
jgi:cell division protein FtsZ